MTSARTTSALSVVSEPAPTSHLESRPGRGCSGNYGDCASGWPAGWPSCPTGSTRRSETWSGPPGLPGQRHPAHLGSACFPELPGHTVEVEPVGEHVVIDQDPSSVDAGVVRHLQCLRNLIAAHIPPR